MPTLSLRQARLGRGLRRFSAYTQHTAQLTPLRNILTRCACQPTNPQVQGKHRFSFIVFYSLVSDCTVMVVCPPQSSFPPKLILVIFSSSVMSYVLAIRGRFPNTSPDGSSEFRTRVFNCLIEVSTWMFRRHPTPNERVTELLPIASKSPRPVVFSSANGNLICSSSRWKPLCHSGSSPFLSPHI